MYWELDEENASLGVIEGCKIMMGERESSPSERKPL
jgi:hypothetical protein